MISISGNGWSSRCGADDSTGYEGEVPLCPAALRRINNVELTPAPLGLYHFTVVEKESGATNIEVHALLWR